VPTKQETFDTVVGHLRKQGRKAVGPYAKGCRYRTSEGLKCAAGVLIPDDEYTRHMEGSPVAVYTDGNKTPAYRCMERHGHDVTLVTELQQIHDCRDPGDWESDFRALASRFGLTYSPPGGSLPPPRPAG
jgi:hypothetical protein